MPSSPEVGSARMARAVLLTLSVLLIVAGLVIRASGTLEAGSREFISGSLIKVGIVLGLGWLAAPQLERLGWERLRGTGLAILLAIGGLTAVRPRLGAIAAGLAVAALIVFSMLGWVRGVIFNGAGTAVTDEKSRKIEKNPTRR